MALDNYADLQVAIANLLNRSDLSSYIPDWISLCEKDVQRRLMVSAMESTASLSITSGSVYVPLPSDFSTLRAYYVDTATEPLVPDLVSLPALFDKYLTTASETGQPRAMAIIGNNIRVAPVPDANYTLNLFYYADIPALSSNGTNWLLTNNPDVYLYGSALHSAAYLGMTNESRFGRIITKWRLTASSETTFTLGLVKDRSRSRFYDTSGFAGSAHLGATICQ